MFYCFRFLSHCFGNSFAVLYNFFYSILFSVYVIFISTLNIFVCFCYPKNYNIYFSWNEEKKCGLLNFSIFFSFFLGNSRHTLLRVVRTEILPDIFFCCDAVCQKSVCTLCAVAAASGIHTTNHFKASVSVFMRVFVLQTTANSTQF